MIRGPNFKILPNCNECEFARFEFIVGEHETGKINCKESGFSIQLTNYHKSSLIQPHNKCPFIQNNKKEFLKNEINKMKFEEFDKIEKKVKEIFPNLTDYSLYTDTDTIIFRIKNTDFNKLYDLKSEINYRIFMAPYSRIGVMELQITLTKE